MLQAGRKEALLAVDLYNRSAAERSLEAFVMHMHVAWLYLLHARFKRDGVDYRYRKPNGHFERIDDGEIKTWELARCLREEFAQHDPVRSNVEFFIRLRNKIEHRYEQLLATAVAGKTQALVLNFEEALVARFGDEEALADSLRFPVFVSSLTPDAVDALKRTHRRLPKKVTAFIREYDASMPEEVQSDWRYDFRVILLPQTGPKTEADAVMRFVREEDMTDEQREARDVVQTIVRTKQVPVKNLRLHKPSAVAAQVQDALGVKFTVWDDVKAWQHFEVRPHKNAKRPELTNERYCVWDVPHEDYLYTDAWVKKLVKELDNRFAFKKIIGRRQRPLRKGDDRAAAS
jgi:hypothetical protein